MEEYYMAYNQETGMYEGFIYKITNNVNGHIYIGQTRQTLEERFYDHTKDCSLKKYSKYGLYKAFKKYGIENFCIEELEKHEFNNKDELKFKLNEREKYYISEARKKYGRNCVYNHSDGGDYDGCATKEIAVLQYDYNCNLIRKYDSIKEAQIVTGANGISGVINKKKDYVTAAGYIWRKADDPISNPEEIIDMRKRFDTFPVSQYGYNGVCINSYNSISDAINYLFDLFKLENNIKIRNWLKSKIKKDCNEKTLTTTYGFIWRYSHDELEFNDEFKKKRLIFAIEKRENGTGKLLKSYRSINSVENDGYDSSVVWQCCIGNKYTHSGFIWNFCGCFDSAILSSEYMKKPIVQLNIDGVFINKYESAIDAHDKTKINRGDILAVCNKRLKTAGNYKWMYLYEYIQNNKEVIEYA